MIASQDIIQLIIAAFGGGLFTSIVAWYMYKRKQNNSDFTSVSSEYKELLLSYKEEVVQLRKSNVERDREISELRLELQQVRNQLMIFESSHADVPLPMWLKDTEGKMLFINSEYEKSILNPLGKRADEYVGNFDKDIWGEKIAKVFRVHDAKIMRTKRPEQFTERWKGVGDSMFEGTVVKYPRFLGKTIIGIGGIIIDINKVE